MLTHDTVQQMDCFTAMAQVPDEGVDVVITDPPYPNGMRLFTNNILDGYAAIYYACKKARNYVVFFWGPSNIPLPPRGWYEVARHIWHKPDGRSINTYETIMVWCKDYRRLSSRVWSIPILDYRSLKDWKPHPTQKPVKLIRYLLDMYTNEGDLVLDPFVGSGTTAVACKQLRRHFIAVDNDAAYVDIANERLRARETPDNAPRRSIDDTRTRNGAPDDDTPIEEPTAEEMHDDLPTDVPPPEAIEEPEPTPQPREAPPKRSHHAAKPHDGTPNRRTRSTSHAATAPQ